MSALQNLPTNISYLSPIGFRFILSNFPEVTYFCQAANIPGVSLAGIDFPTPIKNIQFSELFFQYSRPNTSPIPRPIPMNPAKITVFFLLGLLLSSGASGGSSTCTTVASSTSCILANSYSCFRVVNTPVMTCTSRESRSCSSSSDGEF